jgi:hypothetical protein
MSVVRKIRKNQDLGQAIRNSDVTGDEVNAVAFS